mmetsp:Transcript_40420/g.129792  ORF Transcript_40420/g.129792 Transcript_40420/m.129792 type:complete len:221 (-) Transcript_40420:1365-2027(-)
MPRGSSGARPEQPRPGSAEEAHREPRPKQRPRRPSLQTEGVRALQLPAVAREPTARAPTRESRATGLEQVQELQRELKPAATLTQSLSEVLPGQELERVAMWLWLLAASELKPELLARVPEPKEQARQRVGKATGLEWVQELRRELTPAAPLTQNLSEGLPGQELERVAMWMWLLVASELKPELEPVATAWEPRMVAMRTQELVAEMLPELVTKKAVMRM